jgi:hypothetical protein
LSDPAVDDARDLADIANWRSDGFFSTSRGDGVHVKGVASDSEALAELLRRAGALSASSPVYRARPNDEVRDFGWPQDAATEAGDLTAELENQLRATRPADLVSQLRTLERLLPDNHDELAALAQQRADDLNQVAPQIGSHRLFMPPFDESDVGALGVRDSATRGWATWADWVPTHLLVSTNSRMWNVISRHPQRDTVVRIAEWLHDAVSNGNLDAWLWRMFTHDPMFLIRVEGPAGPIYEVVSGTHRAHAARIWDLPQVLARIQVDRLPKPLRPHTRALKRLWEGLRRRGLFHADTIGETWYLQWIPAEWMLTPPTIATQWNAAYERIYPGELQAATGLTLAELLEPERWVQALS